MANTDISIERLSMLHPAIRQQALEAYAEAVKETPENVHPLVVQTLRTFDESNKLYAQGRTTPGAIVTKSKAGQSYHNYGLALDFALIIDGKLTWIVNDNWMKVVNIFKGYGFTWGGDFAGDFKDYPHLENKLGYNWRTLLSMHDQKRFIPNTTYIDLSFI